MAFQKGIIKVRGTMDDITFMQTKHGYLVRENKPISASRFKTDPAFERARENGAEFGRACKDGKLLRQALRQLIFRSADSDMATRLTSQMMKVIKADPVSIRGGRNTMDGNTALLNGFDFNIKAQLENTFAGKYTVTIDRTIGSIAVGIPEFVPAEFIVAPQGATHCRFVAAGAVVDFDTRTIASIISQSTDVDLKAATQAQINLAGLIGPGSTAPAFVVFGIEFYEQVNGRKYALSNGAFNALTMVAVDGGPRSAQLKIEGLQPPTEDQAA